MPEPHVTAGAPPQVTIVAHDVGTVGGMELQLGTLVAGLVRRGFEVTVIARRCALPPLDGVRFIRVRGPSRPFSVAYPLFFLLGSLAVLRHARGVVHTTGAVVLNRADLSTVHFCHSAFRFTDALVRGSRRSAPYLVNSAVVAVMDRLAERFAYSLRTTRRLVAVSRGVSRELRRHFPRMDAATVVIPNGVDTALFHPDSASRVQTREALGIPPDALVALFVGGEWERKGLAVAIEAVAKSPDWRLLVVGEGDSERYLGLAAAGGAADRVHFAGRSARPAPFFSAADAFLLPTAYETFSLVTYEAAASGLPLLVTRVSGVEDILEDGVNGWFIDRDGPAVAARLRALATDAALRDGMGRRARMASEGFGWDRMVDRYAELYGELATNGRQGS